LTIWTSMTCSKSKKKMSVPLNSRWRDKSNVLKNSDGNAKSAAMIKLSKRSLSVQRKNARRCSKGNKS
jgi:hypothetical protein